MTNDRIVKFRAALAEFDRMVEGMARDEGEVESLRWEVERLESLLVERDEEIRKLGRGLAELTNPRTGDREDLIAKLKIRLQSCRMALAAANEDITGDDERTRFNETDYWLVLRGEEPWESVGIAPEYASIYQQELAGLEHEIGGER